MSSNFRLAGVLSSLVVAACAPGSERWASDAPVDLAVDVLAKRPSGTVTTLHWSTDACPGAIPAVSLEPNQGAAVGAEPGASDVSILGLPPETEVHAIVDLVVDDRVCATGSVDFVTAPEPRMGPQVQLSTDDGSVHGWMVTSILTTPASATILDTQGNVVWYGPVEGKGTVSRAFLSHDRRSVLYGVYVLYPEGPSDELNEIVRVAIDGSSIERLSTHRGHHDMLERQDGTIAYLGLELQDAEGDDEPWQADTIMEILPDGSQRQVWSAWDLFPWKEGDKPDSKEMRKKREWTHANALQYDPTDDTYIVSLRRRSCLVKVDAVTGETRWVLGGDQSTFQLLEGSWAQEQHQFRLEGNRLYQFDNGSVDRMSSRAVEFELDEVAGTARQVWEHYNDPPLYNIVLGDVQPLEGGRTMVTWSAAGQVDVVDAAGQLVWRANTGLGAALGYVQWLEDLEPDLP